MGGRSNQPVTPYVLLIINQLLICGFNEPDHHVIDVTKACVFVFLEKGLKLRER